MFPVRQPAPIDQQPFQGIGKKANEKGLASEKDVRSFFL
jgi:hypothetical protein